MPNIIKKEGFNFAFDQNACIECEGNCCIGESGYVWLTPKEIELISEYLNMSEKEFIKLHTRKIRYKRSLKEIMLDEKNFVCEFFDLKNRRCLIYEVRPNQCRTFPFWEHFINNRSEVEKECPGILRLS